MGSSGMGVDANGKPIKRQTPVVQKKAGGNGGNNNNQKKGNNMNKNNNNKGNNNRNGQNNGNRGGNQHQNRPNNRHPMPLIPPFGPMGGPMGMPMPGAYMAGPPGGFHPGNQGGPNNRRSGGGKNNGNRNGGQQQGYNGPSANNVGQGSVGNNMSLAAQNFGESSVEVPGFGKNSNIHELFGKMIWRKMEQIQDPALVDQLQNRIMNLIHDALAGQNEQHGGGNRGMPFGAPAPQPRGPAFGVNNAGFSRF